MLYGRDTERAVVDGLVADARAGRSGVLQITGELGIGKTALLDHAAQAGADMPILRSIGIESETEVPFAALHLLLRHSLDPIDQLPGPQAGALRGALGLGSAAAGDRFLIGVAVLTLLTEIAGDGPLLCLIDDAGWVDRASADALLFAARRFAAEGIVLILATRAPLAPDLPELRLDPLDRAAAEELLAAYATGLAAAVRERILAAAAGNPLALRELPAALTPEQRAGGLGDELPLPARIEDLYQATIRALPTAARELLLVAAADNTGDTGLVLRAARADVDDAAALEKAQLIRITPTTLTFCHPLIRAATYAGAPLTARWVAHRALADAIGESDPERRAYHLSALATGPDETVAAELERSAARARERGALAAAADVYHRAAVLSTGTAAAVRLTLAAESAQALGNHARATQFVDEAEPHVTDPALQARLATVRGRANYALGQVHAAYRHLRTAVTLRVDDDPEQALWLLAEMVRVARATGSADVAAQTAELLDRLRLPAALVPIQDLLRWMIRRHIGRDTAGLPALPDVAAAALRVDAGGLRGRLFVADAGLVGGDTARIHETIEALVGTIRSRGAVGLLPDALAHQADLQVMRGRYRDARITASEAMDLARAAGQPEWIVHANSVLAMVAAIEGAEEDCLSYAEAALGTATDRTTTAATSGPHLALAMLDLGFGRAERAAQRLDSLVHGSTRFQLRVLRCIPDLIEAEVRSGQPVRAARPLAAYTHWVGQARQPWLDALVLRCRALLAPDAEAERFFQAALDIPAPEHPLEPARTALLYGEWLRRNRRRNDARSQLRTALDTFERLGAQPWADRTRTELRAAGESIGAAERVPDVLDRLTPQELQVVRLAAAGLSNRAIGAQLFLSPRTVGYHLYKAYPKLGVASRAELARWSGL